MSITASQVEAACDKIERALQTFAADPSQVLSAQEALASMHWLRAQYRDNSDVLAGYVDKLRELNSRIVQAVRSARWERVALPNAPRLVKALDDGAFTAEQSAALARLCPVETVLRLTGHANG